MACKTSSNQRTDMINILGSSYRYQGEILERPEIIFIQDHHYNEETRSFPIQQILENSSCDPQQHTLVFDHVLKHDDRLVKYNQVHLPWFLSKSCQQFLEQNIHPNWDNKMCTFNFMINKIRVHRAFLLMLLEHFNLTNYEYTLCWKNNNVNRQSMIKDNPKYQDIIINAQLLFPSRQYLFGHERLLDQGLQYGHSTNSEVYQTFLQSNVFEPSCISLVTEPAFYERETIITEKTIMSIYGGTIPIWVGGWCIADWMRSRGFDVFDDLVDHSYQDLVDPYDRCYEAINKNYKLLSDFAVAKKFVQQNRARLQHNLDLIRTNPFDTECQEKLNNLGIKIF